MSKILAQALAGNLAVAALLASGAPPVRAAEPAVAELMGIFAEACLARFPDDRAVRQYVQDKGFTVMPADQLRRVLGTNPGEGWLRSGTYGQYLLTIEMPPFHTCAIRKANAKGADFLSAYSQALATWAAKQPGTSLKGPSVQTADVGGTPSQVQIWVLERGPGQTPENMMSIVSNFRDGNMELRLVRAVGNR